VSNVICSSKAKCRSYGSSEMERNPQSILSPVLDPGAEQWELDQP